MMPVVLFACVWGVSWTVMVVVWMGFRFLGDQVLVELPQLELQFLERIPIHLVLRVTLQEAAPSVSILHDDVFCGTHEGKYSRTFQMRK
jgi:hypothetical protein